MILKVRGTGTLTLNISVVKLIIGKTEVFENHRDRSIDPKE